jgi:hypothetical protein
MHAEVALIDVSLAEQVFSATTPADAEEIRTMLNELLGDAMPRFRTLREGAAGMSNDVAKRELHQLRGVIANFSLARAASRLRELETTWREIPAATRIEHLTAAEADFGAGIAALRTRYPFLTAAT